MNEKAIAIVSVVLTVAALAGAAEVAAPSTQGAPQGQPLKVMVVSVKGVCDKLLPGEGAETWSPLKVGEALAELTIIRTGMRSEAVLRFDDRGEVIVRRQSKVGISEFRKSGLLVRTQLGLRYGGMHVTVDSTRGKRNDFSVSTPVAILSVTGTSGEISYTLDAGLRLEGETGTWAFIAGNRQRNVKPNESTDENLTPSGERKLAALEVSVDDALGNTGDEASFLREHGAGRGLSFLRGGGGRMNTSPAASALSRSGQLN